jgi:hypothetical protein
MVSRFGAAGKQPPKPAQKKAEQSRRIRKDPSFPTEAVGPPAAKSPAEGGFRDFGRSRVLPGTTRTSVRTRRQRKRKLQSIHNKTASLRHPHCTAVGLQTAEEYAHG